MYFQKPNRYGSVFRKFDRLRRDMDRLMGGCYGKASPEYPALNVWTNESRVTVTAELPGLKPEELDVSVRNNVLSIHGKPDASKCEGTCCRRERPLREFHRTIELPCDVDADCVEARLEKGILSITLPRAETEKPRRISVKAS